MRRPRDLARRRRDERGQATVVIIGFTFVLALAIGVVVDASAAYLHRQDLNALADGAALEAADRGAAGLEVYTDGLGEGPLRVTPASARTAVARYFNQVGAFAQHPGLNYQVTVVSASETVRVTVSAPMELPIRIPGGPESARVSAEGSAEVSPD